MSEARPRMPHDEIKFLSSGSWFKHSRWENRCAILHSNYEINVFKRDGDKHRAKTLKLTDLKVAIDYKCISAKDLVLPNFQLIPGSTSPQILLGFGSGAKKITWIVIRKDSELFDWLKPCLMIGVLDDEETQSHEIVHLDRDNPQLKSQFNGYVSISKGSKLTKERQNWEEISPPVNRACKPSLRDNPAFEPDRDLSSSMNQAGTHQERATPSDTLRSTSTSLGYMSQSQNSLIFESRTQHGVSGSGSTPRSILKTSKQQMSRPKLVVREKSDESDDSDKTLNGECHVYSWIK